jgi:asparagine synthase (glutamine-hydrolysing)
MRLVSERPLGAFLSGGVDSAAVVATLAAIAPGRIKTFSVGFDNEMFNELPYARRVAEIFDTDHVEHVVKADAAAVLPKLVEHYGDPFGDSSAIPSYYVSQVARRDVVVALNGDGGDETFGGYNRYAAGAIAALAETAPRAVRSSVAAFARTLPEARTPSSPYARARRLALSLPVDGAERYASQMSYFSAALRRRLYNPEFAASVDPGYWTEVIATPWRTSTATSPIDRMLDVDVQTYLPDDLLVKMDIATMANSLEARSPFLDHRLMEFAASLPPAEKVRGVRTKVGLKEAFRGTIPDDLLDRPKRGFAVPLAEWLRGPLRPMLIDYLFDQRCHSRSYFRFDVIKRLAHDHLERRIDRSTELWLLLILEIWHRTFIDRLSTGAA